MSEFVKAVRTLGFWRTVYLRWIYRTHMRVAHRFDWHYMPVGGPDHDMLWCQWCGARCKWPANLPSPTLRKAG